MAIVRYYKNDVAYPECTKAIMERLKLYYCQLLYPEEDYTTVSNKRFIQASFDAGDDAQMRRSIDSFKNTQGTFPFTAYNINEDEVGEYYSNYQKNGLYYSSVFNSYISYIPINLTIDMATFYTTSFDYQRAAMILNNDAISLTRLDVPIYLNNILTSFVIDLDTETTKGDLAYNVEQYFNVGKIYPIIHTTIVKGVYFVLTNSFTRSGGAAVGGSSGGQKQSIIRPVDDIILALKQLSDSNNLSNPVNILLDEAHSPNTPIVVSSAPTEGEVDFDRTSPIILTFNVAMNESSVTSNIDVIPFFEYVATWDVDSKILAIDPVDSLQASTNYYVLINAKVKSGDGVTLENDFELNFTTGI